MRLIAGPVRLDKNHHRIALSWSYTGWVVGTTTRRGWKKSGSLDYYLDGCGWWGGRRNLFCFCISKQLPSLWRFLMAQKETWKMAHNSFLFLKKENERNKKVSGVETRIKMWGKHKSLGGLLYNCHILHKLFSFFWCWDHERLAAPSLRMLVEPITVITSGLDKTRHLLWNGREFGAELQSGVL
jgi:hypothetical protein